LTHTAHPAGAPTQSGPEIRITAFRVTKYIYLNQITVDYRCKQIQHLVRINDTHIFKVAYEHINTGCKNRASPRKRKNRPKPMKT
jgi:hypothetical protein